MIDKELIELQKGCNATCAVISNGDDKELDQKVVINANINDNELITYFKEKLLNNEELNYFIIVGIDKIDENTQNRFYQIVKDREYNGYKLPKDLIIVLTVEDKKALKKISKELYHFCVVAF